MSRKGEHIGQMRNRVVIKQYSASQNTYGEETLTWSDLATVWAEIIHQPGGSGEAEEAARQTATTAVRFRMRYRSDVDEKMRLLWDSKLWNIKSILPDNHKVYMIIEAEHQIT